MNKALKILLMTFLAGCSSASESDDKQLPGGPKAKEQIEQPNRAQQFVFAASGLNLRRGPKAVDDVLQTIPLGTAVQVDHKKTGDRLTVEGLSGQMVGVTTGQDTGYVFDGFLAPFPVPVDQSFEGFADQMKAAGFKPEYQEKNLPPTDSSHQEFHTSLELPVGHELAGWQRAWLVAQKLGFMNHEEGYVFAFPGFGPGQKLINTVDGQVFQPNSRAENRKGQWVEEYGIDVNSGMLWFIAVVVIRNKQGNIVSLEERARSDGFGYTMQILPTEGNDLLIKRMAFAD